jgi:pimeloyl-ACP methyl ester carboxylesterase
VNTWLNGAIQTHFRTIDGLSIRYATSDARDDQALLLSPWPESLFAFEPTWLRLAERAHLVAVDLPGFGHSQRRDTLLSPRAMGEFVVHIADAFGLENPHVVGPDIGTGASLFAAASHPGRLRSLVVGSGCSPLTAVVDRSALPDHVREDYFSSYDGDRFVESMRYVRAYPAELPVLHELLPEIRTPVQIIAGARDPAVPPVNAELLHERLPNSKLDIVDAGHFVWEDGADEYAALVTAWWDGDCETTEVH